MTIGELAERIDLLKAVATGQREGFSLAELRTLLPSDLASWEHALCSTRCVARCRISKPCKHSVRNAKPIWLS